VSVEFSPVHSLPADELGARSLLDLELRVWAEVGRARMPAASVVGMAEGAIIDLDCEPDEPAELYVNGRHFGTGRLILVDGEWALRVESLDDGGGDDAEPEVEPASEQDGAVEHLSTPDQGDAQASD
jgi:flagellar motor switch protein FliN/FliY